MATFTEVWYDSTQGGHVKTLVNHVKGLTEGRILEVGCWEGNSSQYVITGAAPEEVLCIDTWQGCLTESAITGVNHATVDLVKQRDIKGQFITNMAAVTDGNYSIVEQEVSGWLSSTTEKIKFCHYDASHDYEACLDILTKMKAIIVEEGCICGDDILSANEGRTDLHGGIEKAAKEVLPGYKTIGNLFYWFNSSKNYQIVDGSVQEVVEPAPVDPTPVDPNTEEIPVDPTLVEPPPADPTPADPTPSDPVPPGSAPAEPLPVDPAPSDPTADPTQV